MKNKTLLLASFVLGIVAGCMSNVNVAIGEDQGVFYAVVVGISDYPGYYDDLAYSASDAVSIKDALAQYAHWEEGNIELVLNTQATKANVRNAIDRLGERATPDDVVLFFYSGHGDVTFDAEPLDEVDRFDETICCYDADVRDDELDEWLSALPTDNIVVLIDACHSGGQIDASSVSGWRAKTRRRAFERSINGDGFAADFRRRRNAKDLSDNPGFVVITSSNADQLSYEIDLVQHGLFTFFVLSAINNFHDFNANSVLAAEEIGMSVLWSFASIYMQYPWLYFSMDQFPQYYDDYPSGAARSGQLPLCYPNR